MSNLEDDSKATEAEKNELHSKIVDQTDQLKSIEDQLVEVQKQREAMEVERDNFDDENVDLKEKMTRLELHYQNEVEELKGKLRDRESDTKYLRDRNAELISSESNLKTSLEGREAAMREAFLKLEHFKSKKDQIEKEKNILREKFEKLKSEETQKEGELSEELRKRKIVITKLEETLASSEKNAKDALHSALIRENSLQSQVEECNTSLKSKEGAMTEAFLSIEKLKTDRDKLLKEKNNLIGICDKLKSDHKGLESVRDNLAKKVISLEGEDAKSKNEMMSLRKKLKDSRSTLEASNEERINIESKVQELQKSVHSLKKQQEETTADFQKKLEDLASADELKGVFIVNLEEENKSNIEKFNKDIEDMKKELRKKDLQLKSYEERVLPLLRSEFNLFNL